MTKLQGALIGCGMIAREHLAAVAQLKNVEITAVCDLSPAKAEATAERFGVKTWYCDLDSLLAEVRPDLVHITTPPTAHFLIAKKCLDAELNVLCEKPITTEYADFVTLREIALRNNCMLIENQNLRFHSSIRRMCRLVGSEEFGDLIDVQICISLNISAPASPYMDKNVAHFGSALRGGVIGDFLPHVAYLAYLFIGRVGEMRTIWEKKKSDSPFSSDEFRALLRGERATASLTFSGNAQPDGFWVRLLGTKMLVECNLFETPRFTTRKLRSGEPALGSVVNGFIESYDVMQGTVAAFWRKLAGVSSYDGLKDLIDQVYNALECKNLQPIALEEIDETARLVDRFTKLDLTE